MHSKKSFLWVIEHDAYFGESGLEGHLQKIQHHTIQISNLLRPNVERRMRYFNQSGPGTFINDFVTLDDSLRSMQILSQQSRLDDSMIDQIFFNNEAVNVAIERMKSYIFEPSSELRRVLLGKITPVLKVIKQITAMWEERFSGRKINILQPAWNEVGHPKDEQGPEVFCPEDVLSDVVDSCLANVFAYTFKGEVSGPRQVFLYLDRNVEEINLRILDNGRGLIDRKPWRGVRKCQENLGRYGADLQVKDRQDAKGTEARIILLSREEAVTWKEN